MYKAPNLPAAKHVFLGSKGGVSEGIYKSLNVSISSGDALENVRRNLEIAAGFLGTTAERLNMMNQGVSSHVEYVQEPTQWHVTADGAVTDQPDVVLCIRTADCAPVLLADYDAGIIGAAHAGWRGAFGGVIANTVDLMVQKGARRENIAAAVGPCIGQASYEVDNGFYQQFQQKNPQWVKYFIPSINCGHYMFDLELFCSDCLLACGVGNVTVSGLDTYALENDYFSFRRNTHRGLVTSPKCFPVEMSAIVL